MRFSRQSLPGTKRRRQPQPTSATGIHVRAASYWDLYTLALIAAPEEHKKPVVPRGATSPRRCGGSRQLCRRKQPKPAATRAPTITSCRWRGSPAAITPSQADSRFVQRANAASGQDGLSLRPPRARRLRRRQSRPAATAQKPQRRGDSYQRSRDAKVLKRGAIAAANKSRGLRLRDGVADRECRPSLRRSSAPKARRCPCRCRGNGPSDFPASH